jgi:hypothetical protein
MRRIILLILLLFFYVPFTLQAQNYLGQLVKVGKEDAQALGTAYLQPANKALGVFLNNGWFNSAEALKLGSFEFKIVSSATISPTDETSFNINNIDLKSGYKVADGQSSSNTPTATGNASEGVLLERKTQLGATTYNENFRMPQGLGSNILGSPMLQFNVGIWKGIEASVRFIPPFEINTDTDASTNFKLIGLGVKWDFQQFIPRLNIAPFHLSLIGGYTKLQARSNVTVRGESSLSQFNIITNLTNQYSDQKIEYDTDAYNVGVMISKKLSFLTLYGSIRQDFSSTLIKMVGVYPFEVLDTRVASLTFTQEVIDNIKDPIYVKNTFNQLTLNAGFRVKMGFFTISVDGSYGDKRYHNLAVTLGFGRYN